MAALNPMCFEKSCKCSVCKFACTECLVPDSLCDKGKSKCIGFIPLFPDIEKSLEAARKHSEFIGRVLKCMDEDQLESEIKAMALETGVVNEESVREGM